MGRIPNKKPAKIQAHVELRNVKAQLRQLRREYHEEMAMADGELKMLSDRLQVLLPVYWAAKEQAEFFDKPRPKNEGDAWPKIEKRMEVALRAAKKVLDKKSAQPRAAKKPRPIS